MYNNQITISQLLRNPKLNNVLPQFSRKIPLQNVYSGAEVIRRVKTYLKGILGASVVKVSDDKWTVNGKHNSILENLKRIAPLIEQFFNSMPALVKNIRNNTRVYTMFSSAGQIEDIRSKKHFDSKMQLLQDLLDNINFNPDFNSLNSVTKLSAAEFANAQAAWCKKVGIRRI